ncbi:hypothetical protein ANN_08533 [Periplaneta americana]|uniref:DUF4817 domain-containing protein n=1 Tax=Periplaneta americana TaxID=6978 RepID=A0ABQ8T372_PERAM|nr:hypothetical protein ANN_08533 [Periplaneta americana]
MTFASRSTRSLRESGKLRVREADGRFGFFIPKYSSLFVRMKILRQDEVSSYRSPAYLKISDSVIETQRQFRTHFRVGRHERIPDKKTFIGEKFQTKGSTFKQKSSGRCRNVRAPENIAAARHAIITSPRLDVQTLNMLWYWEYLIGMSDESYT